MKLTYIIQIKGADGLNHFMEEIEDICEVKDTLAEYRSDYPKDEFLVIKRVDDECTCEFE